MWNRFKAQRGRKALVRIVPSGANVHSFDFQSEFLTQLGNCLAGEGAFYIPAVC